MSTRSSPPRALWTIAVFALAFAWFSVRAARTWLASGYVDPVGGFGTQDEATYSRIALEILERHNWLMPTFLDRIAFFKPPFLFWLSAWSVKLFGASAYALRLPSVLSASGVCALAFAWVARFRGTVAGLAAVALLACDYYWILLGSLNMTDAPLAFLSLLALFTALIDPPFARRRTILILALALGASLLTKSVAAFPVLAALLIHALSTKTRLRNVLLLLAGPSLVAAPWFLYALLFHFRWFWREHILTELLGHNVAGTAFGSPPENLLFYFQRLVQPDPIIAIVGAMALVYALWRRRFDESRLILLWLGFTVLVMAAFGYHAAAYLLPVVTGLAILAGLALSASRWRWNLGALCAIIAAQAWTLAHDTKIVWSGTNLAVAPALVSYCGQYRPNSLMLIETDDEFFSATEPLPRVHYGLIAQGRAAFRLAIDFQSLGIVVSSDEFDRRPETWPVFRERLTAMGLPPWFDPRATEVLFRDRATIAAFIAHHPEIDFLVPRGYVASDAGHRAVEAGPEHLFLLASQPAPGDLPRHRWACRL